MNAAVGPLEVWCVPVGGVGRWVLVLMTKPWILYAGRVSSHSISHL